MAESARMATVGEIARRFATEVHKVQYVIRTRSIRADGRAGNVRVFSDAAVQRIGVELRRILSGSQGGGQ